MQRRQSSDDRHGRAPSSADQRPDWFRARAAALEAAYLQGEQPWQQSGFGLNHPRSYEDWEACRRPVADAVDTSGSFLDIGCANGFLLECLLRWTSRRGITLEPFGLDISGALVALARERLPAHAGHLFTGNALDWEPPRRFDYVRTEMVYVPDELRAAYVRRILDRFLAPGGRLLAAEYTSTGPCTVDDELRSLGLTVESTRSGYLEGVEKARIAVIRRAAGAEDSPQGD